MEREMGEQAGEGYELYMDSICSQGKRQAQLEPDSTKKRVKKKVKYKMKGHFLTY